MICTYTGTTNKNVHGKRWPSIWSASRATLLLTACLLVAGLSPSTASAQAASYRWAHVEGYQQISTNQSVTLGGTAWPNSPGTRTFEVIVALNDGTQATAEQSITFTNP